MKCIFCILRAWILTAFVGIALRAQSLDVTSTGINGTAIGSTTPSPGAFTTLQASGPTTLSGGLVSIITGSDGSALAVQARASDDFAWAPLAKNHAGTTYLGGIAWTPSGFMTIYGGSGLTQIAAFTSSGLDVAGTVSAVACNTTSDARLKTNIRDFTDSDRIIDALRPRLFDWKAGGKNTYGFVAQEVYAVFPQAVSKGDDDPATITRQWSMDASKLVPVLTAEIKGLRSRVAALEAARTSETSAIADLTRQLAALRMEVAGRNDRGSAAPLLSWVEPHAP